MVNRNETMQDVQVVLNTERSIPITDADFSIHPSDPSKDASGRIVFEGSNEDVLRMMSKPGVTLDIDCYECLWTFFDVEVEEYNRHLNSSVTSSQFNDGLFEYSVDPEKAGKTVTEVKWSAPKYHRLTKDSDSGTGLHINEDLEYERVTG